MTYQHTWIDGSPIELPVGKVVCVGRNYAEHAKELGNAVPETPLLFIKPASALVPATPGFSIPTAWGEVHHEIELAILIGERLQNADAEEARWSVAGFGLAFDLTLRDLQNELKKNGHPWERAKAFDGSCPVSSFVDARGISTKQALEITLSINDQLRQRGLTSQMLFPMFELIAHMSQVFTLEPGDLVLTGTPSGVAALHDGDRFDATLGNTLRITGTITASA